MDIIFLYLAAGLPIAVVELIAVLFIRDGASLLSKLLYGMMGWVCWPLLLIVLFIPNKALDRIQVALKRAING